MMAVTQQTALPVLVLFSEQIPIIQRRGYKIINLVWPLLSNLPATAGLTLS